MKDREVVEKLKKMIEKGINYGFKLNPHTLYIAFEFHTIKREDK